MFAAMTLVARMFLTKIVQTVSESGICTWCFWTVFL